MGIKRTMAVCKVGNQYKNSAASSCSLWTKNVQNNKYGLLSGHKTTTLIISSVNQNSEAW